MEMGDHVLPEDVPTSASLLLRIRAGDAEGWRRFAVIYSPLVLRWLERASVSLDDRDDVLQDVLQKVVRSIATFQVRRQGDSFRRWLKTITINTAIDLHRKQSDEPVARGGSTAMARLSRIPAPDDPEMDSEEQREVSLRTLDLIQSEFKPTTWQAFRQVVIEQRSIADVAADLNMTPANVRMAKSRVLARLREELGGLESPGGG